MMPSWMTLRTLSASLPDHCTPENEYLAYISSTFHTCMPTPLATLSTLLGSLSIVSWLFAQVPQIYKNYTLQSTSGLSLYFLIEWCLGDTTNLFGAILTRQATWQVIVASYYVSVDVILVTQYFWYTCYKPWREEQDRINGVSRNRRDDSNITPTVDRVSVSNSTSATRPSTSDCRGGECKTPSKPVAAPFNSFRFPGFSSPREKGTPSSSNPTIHRIHRASSSPAPSPKTVLLISMLCAVLSCASPLQSSPSSDILTIGTLSGSESNRELIGRLLSWTSTILYLGSRLPQIYKNHIRRSTTGLSPTLFIAAFFGNLFYSSSLLTNPLAYSSYPPYGLHGWVGPEGSDRNTWVALAAPFWLGAAGVLSLDAAVGVQFLVFGEKAIVVRIPGRDKRGRGRWRRVSGWMRGWVPSVSPRRDQTVVAEERRGLLGSDTRTGGDQSYGGV